MAFFGLVPTESSSGESRHQGGISKTGNAQVRRVLIQSAQTYRFLPSLHGLVGRRLAACGSWQADLSAISWRCQQRLHGRLRRVMARRGKPKALNSEGASPTTFCTLQRIIPVIAGTRLVVDRLGYRASRRLGAFGRSNQPDFA